MQISNCPRLLTFETENVTNNIIENIHIDALFDIRDE